MGLEEFISKIPNFTKNDFLSDTITPLNELIEKSSEHMKCKMELFVTYLQAVIVRKLEEYESKAKFIVDPWKREEGGGGITCVLQGGDVFEKVGLSVSAIWGELQKKSVESMIRRKKDLSVEGKNSFFATGVSCILHPINPNIPSMHFNYRYFEVLNESGKLIWWFGGGTDITPTYIIEKDVIHFHQTQKNACDQHNKEFYPKFKKKADEYFYIEHRNEHRGVGGLFFDDFDELPIDECFSFVASCGHAILPSYVCIVEEHKDDDFTEQQREWQLLRRGRYIEFTLIYDRGTKFGLVLPGARIESILMSLPLLATWEDAYTINEGSPEDVLVKVLRNPKEWV